MPRAKPGSECTFPHAQPAFADRPCRTMPSSLGRHSKDALMPRQPRLDLAQIPQHVVQRGNDRQPCFFTDVERVRYLQDLREIALREGCAVHAYVLMTNHVHLLMTPTAAGQITRVMQSVHSGPCFADHNEHLRLAEATLGTMH